MLQNYLQKYFTKAFYPTPHRNWYKEKGYVGADSSLQFADFLTTQKKNKTSKFHEEFKSLDITRQYVNSGEHKLDSVILTPYKSISRNKPGEGLYFVMFQGRGEYYESRFRDMALQAKETGASVVGFNPKGFHASSGKTQKLYDIVEDGIAIIGFLLEKGIPSNRIIMQGNSLGAGVQEMVSEHYAHVKNIRFRQINSNSFKNLASVLAYHYKAPILERVFSVILKYAGWEISVGAEFYKTGPYRCLLRRKGDRTIGGFAEYNAMVNHQEDYENCSKDYRETNKWLNEHNQLIYTGRSKKDPHALSLHHFAIKGEGKRSVYYLINRYLAASNTIVVI
ncbi:MAG: hypothetical protein COA94_00135 [Rickettsiales bacterium]|nr:MAG: hypothetical protein COA94_00135 [Rickettsiales bacterium]